jgi:hypothetical protein
LRAQSQPELHSEVQPRLGYIESSCFKIPTPSKKKKQERRKEEPELKFFSIWDNENKDQMTDWQDSDCGENETPSGPHLRW